MAIPNLQVALDHSNTAEAVAAAVSVGNEIDIVEAGTVLMLEVGSEVVQILRKLFPDKPIVADTKCADAGTTIARNCKNQGADIMTCICAAEVATMTSAAKEIDHIQVELYGDWTYEQAQEWLDNGIEQVVYHQSRDALLAGVTWGEKDLEKVQKLIDMGFKVSVTGGLNLETIELFKGVDVYTFIAGRAITEAENPAAAAKELKDKIKELWA
ncbi:3-keto-L-gulonate-6-phosphate decarboxylase [Suicoccus acidiformans]|uniref:3-hexulose-6-phosphate synthase n=1 Tax=Suicoccus acidiformans TaxID=2036206 RepID=A0A347WIG7_9LACT|nr:3-keto-L-gulonate-6-phosphate decarboxylase UlaD [Suicoccus acidiformans]AXY24874.1 3-keto-L-gulonate-6-phosphate decarboxylase [Suicoccus acidiformans]